MLKLNVALINSIPKLSGETAKDFTEKVFGPGRKHMWPQNKKAEWNALTCTSLVKIANAYHIPLQYLIINDIDKFAYHDIRDIQHEDWKEIKFTPENICNEYRKDNPKFMLKEFAESMDTTSSCVYRWFVKEGNCSMSVKQALSMTFRLNLELSFIFRDDNEPLPSHLILNTTEGTERAVNEMRQLREQVRDQQRHIRNLQDENTMLRERVPQYDINEAVGEYNCRIRPFVFNQELWDNISIVLGKSKREVERITGVRSVVSTPTVIQLIQLCNALGISTHHFIQRSVVSPTLRSADYYQTEFIPVSFTPERIDCLFRVGNILNQKRKDTLEILGVNDMISRRWTKPDSTINVMQLIDMCNALDVLPSLCINDKNNRNYGSTLTELLLEENMMLRLRLADLENKSKKQTNNED